MVTRVTTPGNYSAVLANLLAAQRNQMVAGDKVSTQKNGQNLKDYAKSSELLTAMRSVQTRLGVYEDQNKLLSDKLDTQNTALSRVADAAQAVRQVFAEALASGRADTLVEDVEAELRNAVEGMNGRYGGKYLFAGGQVDTRPVTATTLTDLTAGPPISSFFKNDNFKVTAKSDEATTITTGILADNIGADLLTAFQTFQSFNQGAQGPFTGALTAAQQTFLEGQLANWDSVRTDITNIAAYNGVNQKRLETIATDITTRQNSLAGMIGDITDADMASAAAQLQQAQLSVQSAAYVFQALQESSLINLLR
ncbi:MAG: flagellin [Alphaproteobacteria bacterium]|nr:flagellin [Alphaproteobacteria bacterium]MBU1513411.1 flagellin [Alphaproteobacteria bacterium]MBU2096403.1 flagellin [Alphaproteobacteria bacterium]MBU2149905.1 flagellin [Alphaproteobacteria bacterium]MBU2308189.1 flagellin [Alphaproteobacteria bacterium]